MYSDEVKSQTTSVSFSVFYNSLKPYGHWVNHSKYGQIWISDTRSFVPYSTAGHWAYTDYGWTWISDYNWGWAPFHYGRWSYESNYGWYWVPGYEWAPAWVAWRSGGDYYGWAPLSPGLNINVGVSFGNSIPENRWVFAPHQYITSPYINRYYVPRTRNITIIKNTTIVNNVTVKNNVHYVAGPNRQDVERVNHTKVQTYTVANSSKPGKTVINNNTVNVYRPVINNNKTVVNNNSTTINKNSNNTTVNRNSNNKTITKNNKTTITKNSNNHLTVNKETSTVNNETVTKTPQENKNPALNQAVNKRVKNNNQRTNAGEVLNTSNQKPQQNDISKRKNQHNDNNNRKRK